jgi:hypothetical protein
LWRKYSLKKSSLELLVFTICFCDMTKNVPVSRFLIQDDNPTMSAVAPPTVVGADVVPSTTFVEANEVPSTTTVVEGTASAHTTVGGATAGIEGSYT